MILNIELVNKHMREVRELSLTASELQNTIAGYTYTGEKRIKDPSVENAKLPPIALSFYSCVYSKNSVPSPEEVFTDYLSQPYFMVTPHGTVKVSYGTDNTELNLEGVEARVLRTYPSLVRDLHFYLMAVESNYFEGVWYSLEDDFKNGIDIKVRYNGRWYNIALLQNTARSLFFKNKKKNRHNGSNADMIYIELDTQKCQRCGDYYLFTSNDVKSVYNTIIKKV